MKNAVIIATTAVSLSAAVLGSGGPAAAAPSGGAANAEQTIAQLEQMGNRVVVNRLSETPLSRATVVSVRTAGDIRTGMWDSDRDAYHYFVTGKVYYLDIR